MSLLFVFFFLTSTFSEASPPSPLFFAFPSFGPSSQDALAFSLNSGISQGALQITPDTINNVDYLLNRSGRVLLRRPFRLWDSARTASFNSSFSINIYRPSNASLPGEGLAFLVSSDPSPDPPPASHAGFLGLTNSTSDGLPSNRFVAIELDTVKQPYDPDDNHVGLDVNGVVSLLSQSLTPFDIRISPPEAANYTVWIDYDGRASLIQVFMIRQGSPKPSHPVLASKLDLRAHVDQDSFFGFAASTGAADYELNCVLSWNLTVENIESQKSATGWKVAAGTAAAAVAVAASGTAIWCLRRRRKPRGKKETAAAAAADPSFLAGTLKSLPGMPREFEYKELRKATNGFDERMKLGQGGFGIVYRGSIEGEETDVAVKKFSREDNMNSQDDFLKELTVINRLRHKHLVRLRGWCHENGVLLLVYDYMPNGSLDQHLYGGPGGPPRSHLPWNDRLQIAADVASALHYLHHEYNECVVHRDLKSSNVMLDTALRARLGDFGLARVLDTGKTSYAELEAVGVPGTLGYIAPECFHTGKATRESDVFAFGALILELVCGRRPRCTDLPGFHFLVDWVWTMHRDERILGAVDKSLDGNFAPDEARRLLLLGLACSHPMSGERPKAAAILQVLSGLAPPPAVPAFKPTFMWPAEEMAGGEGMVSVSSLLTSTSLYQSSTGSSARSS